MYTPISTKGMTRWVIRNRKTSQYFTGRKDESGKPIFKTDVKSSWLIPSREIARFIMKSEETDGCHICKVLIDYVAVKLD